MPSEHEPPSTPADISQCEIEPVHIPGAIQAHGVLLALHGPTLRVVQASANCQALLGCSPGELLERDLGITLGEPLAETVREALGRYLNLPDAPAAFSWRVPSGDRQLSGYVHQSGDLQVLEFELATAGRADSHDTTRLGEAARAARLVHAQPELSGKVEVAAEWLRRVTGYDRVMVYQFHEDCHGEVIAESRRANLKPYLGLHYPASDIPAQARRLYLVSPTRAIADVDYSPSPLVPAANPVTGRPLDLSQSLLRSVSPIHLQYLRNMGVRASLTASILRDGQLWGLVSCHHSSPRLASTATREIATWLAQDLASQIALTQDARTRRYSAQLKECRNRISVAMQAGARLRDLLHEPTLADFLGAVGADGAAVVDGLNVTTCGVTPDADRVLQLVRGISAIATQASSDLFVTDCVSQHLPEATDLAPTAAGMGVFPMDEGQSLKLVWFRGEQLRLVKWGGNPDKAVAVTPDGRLSPRLSFDVWTESVRHRSLPWRAEELESARELRAMLDLELRREAEDAVRASQVLLTDVLDSLSSHIAVLDGQGVILAVNLAWRRFAEANGGGEDTVAGVDYLAVCRQAAARPDGEEAASALQGILEVLGGARRDFRTEYPCHGPSEQRWFMMRVFRLTGTNAGAVIVHEDITARKAFNRALESRVSKAVAEVRVRDQLLITQGRQAAMGEMIGNIAHQWRQPLNSLELVLVNLQDSSQAGELEAQGVDDAVELAGRLIQKMSSTIDVFRDFFKPEKQKHAFSALAQVRETVALLEASFTNVGITIAVHAAEDVTLFGFSNEYSQVLLNLLSNARHAIQGTKAVAGRVTVRLGIRDGLGCLTVRDNGGGIPEAVVDRIFDPYFSTKEGGSGIGLYMSRQIAEQSQGGRLDVTNVSDGAEFTLFTPLADKAPR